MSDDQNVPRKAFSGHVKSLLIGVTIINLLVCLLAGVIVYRDYLQHKEAAKTTTQNIAQVLDQNVNGVFGKAELTAHAVVDEAERQLASGGINSAQINTYLGNRLKDLPELVAIRIIAPDGTIPFNSEPSYKPNPAVNVSDRGYFKQLRDNPDAKTIITDPVRGRISGLWVVPVAQRINKPDGTFAGVVLVSISQKYFTDLFATLAIGKQGAIALRDRDLKAIARYPESKQSNSVGQKSTTIEFLKLIQRGDTSGTFTGSSSFDNVERIFSFRTLAHFPMYILVAQADSDYLADWYTNIYHSLLLAICFMAASLFAARQMHLRWQGKQAAVVALQKSHEALEQMVEERTAELSQKNTALAAAKEAWEHTFNIITDPLMIIDREFRILQINQAALDKLQMTREQALASTCLSCIDGTDTPPDYCPQMKTLQSLTSHTTEVSIERFGGHYIVSTTPIFDSDGNYQASIYLTHNITERNEIEQALQHERTTLRTLINAIPDIVCFKDGEDRWLEANELARKLFGLEKVDYHGRKDSELAAYRPFYRDFFIGCEASDEIAWNNGGPSRSEEFVRRPNGSLLTFDVIKVPLFDEQGGRTGLIVVGRDITEKKVFADKLAESEQRYRLLFENMSAGLALHEIICDKQGKPRDYRYLAVNPAFEQMTGFKAADIIGKTVLEVMPETEAYWIEKYGHVALTGEALIYENYATALGKYYNVSAYRPKEGQFSVTFTDITDRVLSVESLRQNEERLRTIGDNLPGGMTYELDMGVAGEMRSFTYLSAGVEKLHGVSADDVKRNPQLLYGQYLEEDRAIMADEETRAMISMTPFHIEARYRTTTGEVCWSLITSTPRRTPDGHLLWSGIEVDITKQKQAEALLRESQAQLRSIADSSLSAIIMIDARGMITFWNPAAETILGYTRQEAMGKNLHLLFAPTRHHAAFEQAFPQFNHTGQGPAIGKTIELSARRKDGQEIAILLSLSSVELQGEWHAVGIIQDISELKTYQQNLIEAKEAAEVATQAKSQFLANMSHEIRTPMNGVLGMTQLLEMTDLTEEQRGYIAALMLSGKNLMSLINDILDLSKIEAGNITIEPVEFDLRRAIEEVSMTQKSAIFGKNLFLDISIAEDVPNILRGDQLRFKQILLNLLGNAAKFTKQGGITIAAQTYERHNGSLIIQVSVTDTGIGIAAGAFDKIFKPFVQEDGSTTRQFGGTGLGLTICRRLAELMGGDISVESTQGVGSCFRVKLPFIIPTATNPREFETHTTIPAWDGPPLRILLVEDNPINMKFGMILLGKHGHEVVMAENGKECLEALDQGAFDLVLMDVQMPVMNGEETLRAIRIKEQGTSCHQRVIALTAYALRGEKERFLMEGFDGYLSKPMEIRELAVEIKRVMSV